MIHIRIDHEVGKSKRRFACGIGPELPAGDVYFFASEGAARFADCPDCNPGGPKPIGTPLSELSGRPGQPGFKRFCEIARSWRYE